MQQNLDTIFQTLKNADYKLIELDRTTTEKEFLNLRSEWLIKNADLNLIEEYLIKNQIINLHPRLTRYLLDQ